jgi:hypothetical protein
MAQQVNQHDLILISDSGKFYLIKMKETPAGHEPQAVEELEVQLQTLPEKLRAHGVEVADIPDNLSAGGASCYLLNLQRLSGRG